MSADLLNVVDMKHCDANAADLTSRYVWCQRRLAAADSLRDFDSVSDRCRHHQCCLLADRLCAADIVPRGKLHSCLVRYICVCCRLLIVSVPVDADSLWPCRSPLWWPRCAGTLLPKLQHCHMQHFSWSSVLTFHLQRTVLMWPKTHFFHQSYNLLRTLCLWTKCLYARFCV